MEHTPFPLWDQLEALPGQRAEGHRPEAEQFAAEWTHVMMNTCDDIISC